MNKRIMGLESEYGSIIIKPDGKFSSLVLDGRDSNHSEEIEFFLKDLPNGFHSNGMRQYRFTDPKLNFCKP